MNQQPVLNPGRINFKETKCPQTGFRKSIAESLKKWKGTSIVRHGQRQDKEPELFRNGVLKIEEI
jgi:hypothetical protein